jgi:hypothetical protein
MAPLADFTGKARFERRLFSRNGEDHPVYFFHFEDFTVWGATAKIFKQFLELALGFVEPMPGLGYSEKAPPVP